MSRQQVLAPVDTEAVLQGVLLNLDVSIRESGSTNRQPRPCPKCMSDFAQLGQVFQNLISNAIKYRRAEPPQIHIWAEDSTMSGCSAFPR